MTQTDFDVAIIGGGPAGSTVAAYLARAGVDCAVFEREMFPRPHVGESLVPSTNRILNDLGLLPKMEAAGFIHKFGAAWTSEVTNRHWQLDWEGLKAADYVDVTLAARPQPGQNQFYTYHVDRGIFDQLLLQHASELGAKVFEGISVKGVDFSDPEVVRFRYGLGRRDPEATCRVLIDASGRRTLLGNQLRWRIKDPMFDQYALHAWFEGYDRMAWARNESTRDYIYIHFLPLTNTWVWQIPITETVTSIGVVTQKRSFTASRESREAFFWSAVSSRPDVLEALRAANEVRPIKEEGDYSYAMEQIAADRLLLIGDAARFVDPIFSTGVSIAMHSAKFAAEDLLPALEHGDLGRAKFNRYEEIMGRGMRNWYSFISIYYRLNVLFTAFLADQRYKFDMLQLLQGDVYDEQEPPVLGRMREIVAQVERDEGHVWHKLLGTLTANAFAKPFP